MEILYYMKIKYYIPIYNRQQIYVNSGKLLKQDKLCGYFVCNVSCPSRFLCSNLFIVVMTVYINLMQPHLKHRSDFTTCMFPPPAPSTSIVIPQCTFTQGKHWIIICMRSIRKCLFEIVLSPVSFSLIPGCRKRVNLLTLLYSSLIRRESGPQGQDVILNLFKIKFFLPCLERQSFHSVFVL